MTTPREYFVQVPISREEWDHLQAIASGARMDDGVAVLRHMVELAVEGLANPGQEFEARWLRATLRADYAFPIESLGGRSHAQTPTKAIRDLPLPASVFENPTTVGRPLNDVERKRLERLEDRGPVEFGKLPKKLFAAVPACCRAGLLSRRGALVVLTGHGRRVLAMQ